MMEILEMVDRELVVSGQKTRINGGIVLTGGTALLANIVDLAEQIFDLPVRIGYPSGVGGRIDDIFTPRCTTGVGLVMYGRDQQKNNMNLELGMVEKMKGWFKKMM
jgi:cell division protein FtsA